MIILYNFLCEDISILTSTSFTKFVDYSFISGSTSGYNYIFLYLIFVSITPVFYISPVIKGSGLRDHVYYLLTIYLFSTLFLLSNNLFIFIFFYEASILPIFFILRAYGHYYRRTQAAFFILIWALLGSFFLFLGLFFLSYYSLFLNNWFFFLESSYIWISIFFLILGFSVKAPLWPFHFWISRAHAEGPTNLSIFLSGVLVKLSVFGILKVLEISFVKFSFLLFYFLAVIGVIDSTLKMLIQIDSKVVIAFSTTVQMNFLLFIIFSTVPGVEKTLGLGLVNHMLTASLLFFISDIILVRFNTREFFFLVGLYRVIPLFSVFLLFSLINQINFPGFLGFILDLNFLYSVFSNSPVTSFFLFLFLFNIEHLYILFFFLKICFGVSNKFSNIVTKDLTFSELMLFVYLLSISLIWGIFPSLFFNIFY